MAVNSDNVLLDKPLEVSEINHLLKVFITERFYNLSVVGEISTFRPSANGHWYFKLKDEKSQIDAVMFRGQNAICDFIPADGDLVEVTGSIDVFEPRGTYQIIVQSMKRGGLGQILAMLQKKKEYYRSLGWFDQSSKPALPRYPENIGVVTALTGAAVRDILDTTRRRAPCVDVTIYPVLVQGESAASQISAAIRQANDLMLSDVLIVGRGGGSVEDLLPFSDDEVVKAVHESRIPVISAVGHEIDESICDLVASRKAITPTDGAMIATAGYEEARQKLPSLEKERKASVRQRCWQASSRIVSLDYLSHLVEKRLAVIDTSSVEYLGRILTEKTDSLTLRLSYAFDGIIAEERLLVRQKSEIVRLLMKECMENLDRKLKERENGTRSASGGLMLLLEKKLLKAESLMPSASMMREAVITRWKNRALRLESLMSVCEASGPQTALDRGYALVQRKDGSIVTSAEALRCGDRLRIRLKDGTVPVTVEGDGV